jgi:hypothetical protein
MNPTDRDQTQSLRRLAWTGAGLALGLIVLGGVVRREDGRREVPAEVGCAAEVGRYRSGLALRADSDKVPYFVYPDPPLAKQELDLLAELEPKLRLTTPTLLFAKPSQPLALAGQNLEKAAAGWRIGLSISDSADLPMRGFGPAHLRDAASEFARFLLAAGATLAYGGDLRQGGFTEVLFELLTAYRAISGEAGGRRTEWSCDRGNRSCGHSSTASYCFGPFVRNGCRLSPCRCRRMPP